MLWRSRSGSQFAGLLVLRALAPVTADRSRSGRRRPLQAQRSGELVFDLVPDLRVLAQEGLGIVASLAEPLAVVAEESTRLLDHAMLDAEVEQTTFARDADPVIDVELGQPERRCDLVLDDLRAHPVANGLRSLLEGLDSA